MGSVELARQLFVKRFYTVVGPSWLAVDIGHSNTYNSNSLIFDVIQKGCEDQSFDHTLRTEQGMPLMELVGERNGSAIAIFTTLCTSVYSVTSLTIPCFALVSIEPTNMITIINVTVAISHLEI